MIGALIIVLREVIEAGLIVGIVLAVTKTMPKRLPYIWGGLAAGLFGAGLVALFAGTLSNAFEGVGQELFNAFDPRDRGRHADLAQCLDGAPWPRTLG